MTPDLQAEFADLYTDAKNWLRKVPASATHKQVFSIWVFPSFTESFRWTVFTPHLNAKTAQPFASLVVWRSDLDFEKFRSPLERLKFPKKLSPTIDEESVMLTDSDVAELLEEIRTVLVPVFIDGPTVVGCDGTNYEFRYSEYFFGMTLHWWENHPDEWRPFTDAVMRIEESLQRRRRIPRH